MLRVAVRPHGRPRRVATLLPATAHAHLVDTGFGGFYDGLAHLVSTPADLLVVIALALLAGRSGAPAARRALLAVPLAWVAGGLVGARRARPARGVAHDADLRAGRLAVALDARFAPPPSSRSRRWRAWSTA